MTVFSLVNGTSKMKNHTRQIYNAYLGNLARNHAVDNMLGNRINYSEKAQTSILKTISNESDFLGKVNTYLVDEQVGGKLDLAYEKPLASRTDTDVDERQTQEPNTDKEEYRCWQTNYDAHISYKVLDAWAHLGKEFKQRYRKHLHQQVARDRMMVAWNGQRAGKKTNLEENPLLQDVNEGWLAKLAKYSPKNLLGINPDGSVSDEKIKLGKEGEYKNLDSFVFELMASLLDPWYVATDDLVVMVGREVWTAHGLSILESVSQPTERRALATWQASELVAGLPCVMPPFMPARSIVVTSFSNLSIYLQLGTLRRCIIDNPKRDRVEEYRSENEAFLIEDYGKIAAVRSENVLLPDGQGGWH